MPPSGCEQCDDTGWIEIRKGSRTVARRCHCRLPASRAAKGVQLGLPPKLAGLSFETLEFPNHSRERHGFNQLHEVVARAKIYADEFPVGPKLGLVLHGENFRRASEVGAATLRQLSDHGFKCLYVEYRSLLQRLAARTSSDFQTAEIGRQVARAVSQADVLLVDSFGERRITDWATDTVSALIKHRDDHNKGLILTSSLPMRRPGVTSQSVLGSLSRFDTGEHNSSMQDHVGWQTYDRLLRMCQFVEVRHDHESGEKTPADRPETSYRSNVQR